jgi:hypothetical protein
MTGLIWRHLLTRWPAEMSPHELKCLVSIVSRRLASSPMGRVRPIARRTALFKFRILILASFMLLFLYQPPCCEITPTGVLSQSSSPGRYLQSMQHFFVPAKFNGRGVLREKPKIDRGKIQNVRPDMLPRRISKLPFTPCQKQSEPSRGRLRTLMPPVILQRFPPHVSRKGLADFF